MPIFFETEPAPGTKLAVWKIEEDEAFFAGRIPLQRTITHPHKRLQHLAGRWLLQHLFPDFPVDLIRVADTRKPYLHDEAYHFSISHCGDYAGAIASRHQRVGIDIELFSEKVQRIRHKFISASEETLVNDALGGRTLEQATLLWSCKEALFKWYGKGGLDFREHMRALAIDTNGGDTVETRFSFSKEEPVNVGLTSQLFPHLCVSWVATPG
jgi:phosphopantetheinyl transferase